MNKVDRRKPRRRGFFSEMSDRQLIAWVKKEYDGITLLEFEKRDASALVPIRKRKLVDELVNRGIIIRVNPPNGIYSEASNNELVEFVKNNYKGKRVTEIEDSRPGLVYQLRERGILDKLVAKGIVARVGRKNHYFEDYTRAELISYFRKNHESACLTDIAQKDKTAYKEIKKRKLDDYLVNSGILIRKEAKKGFFLKMGNSELTEWIKQNYSGWKLSDFQRDRSRPYILARKKGLIQSLVKQGILIASGGSLEEREKAEYNFLKQNETAKEIVSLMSVSEDASGIAEILVRLWPNRFPSASKLARSLPGAVRRIGYSLQPFTMEKARGLYDKAKSLPQKIQYDLDSILYSIAIDQYQPIFNKNPRKTLKELKTFAAQKNGIRRLSQKVLDYYSEAYHFSIPGYGALESK